MNARVAPLLALPLAGLALLLARPGLDGHWEHHPAHFWLVLATAAASAVTGFAMAEAARRREDARVQLVGLAFLVSAGFLGLHALATPGVLLDTRTNGFVIATPVGLLIAAALAAASVHPPAAAVRYERQLRTGALLLLGVWAAVSLTGLPPLDRTAPERASGALVVPAVIGVALYAYAAWQYAQLHWRRPAFLTASIAAAWVLLAEALAAVALGRAWHASWWEWHALMALAFGLVAVAVRRAYREHRSAAATFAPLFLDETLERVDARYAEAVRDLGARRATTAEVRERLGLGYDEARVLEQAAAELRSLDERLGRYVPPQLAERLTHEPELARLGGETRDVSVLFADLAGFTAFSENRPPLEVIEMLNGYWRVAVPLLLDDHGGLIERFAGDAVMVVFNAAEEQADHARRAARAAVALVAATDAGGGADWPRFRAGVATGPAVVGNVGTDAQRSFTAIGDTTNLAARLQAVAEPGGVVVSAATAAALGDAAQLDPLGDLDLKGKAAPVAAFELRAVD